MNVNHDRKKKSKELVSKTYRKNKIQTIIKFRIIQWSGIKVPPSTKKLYNLNIHFLFKFKQFSAQMIYLTHDNDGWENIKSYFDYIIYIDADIDTCIDRLKIRNKVIPGYSPEEIEKRCDEVDRVNAHTVEKSRKYATVEVQSGFA